MQQKLLIILLWVAGGWQYASGQIGASTFSYAGIGTDSVGKSSQIGAATLPRCLPRSFSCSQAFEYTFLGNGNWTIPANWEGGVIPPSSLPQGAVIIIDPVTNGECILNVVQTVLDNGSIIVKAGKRLRLLNRLIIQH